MSEAVRELFLETAEGEGWLNGWLTERVNKKIIEVAKRCLKLGIPVEEVTEVTGLSYETVVDLKNNI